MQIASALVSLFFSACLFCDYAGNRSFAFENYSDIFYSLFKYFCVSILIPNIDNIKDNLFIKKISLHSE